MREIKYKAWDLKNKKWLNLWQILFSEDGEAKAVKDINGERFGLNQVELLEFTGLHDKNGKEIYSGDFVVLFNLKDAFFEIIKHKGCFGYLISSEFVPLCGHHIRPDVMEVIGNIYENGDLLKGGV